MSADSSLGENSRVAACGNDAVKRHRGSPKLFLPSVSALTRLPKRIKATTGFTSKIFPFLIYSLLFIICSALLSGVLLSAWRIFFSFLFASTYLPCFLPSASYGLAARSALSQLDEE